jgi:RNA polymerase sigma-70 factor (ECF subfamily)
VAHNVGASHIIRRRGARAARQVGLEELAELPADDNPEQALTNSRHLARLLDLIGRLKPPDRQVMLLYLEDLDAAAIGEITGLSAGAVATRIHRVKAVLARRFHQGADHGA